jgi:hypothetical protein
MTDIVKKPKKTMTPQRLEQLALARKKALEIRQAGAVLKMEAKIANITQPDQIDETDETELPKKEIQPKKQETASGAAPNFKETPPKEIENKIIKGEFIDNPVSQEYVPDFSPRVDVQPPTLLKHSVTIYDDDEEEPEPEPAPVKKVKPTNAERARARPIKTKIVIEQSSDDEDEFHPHEHVIFVKRKSKNDSKAKIVPAATPPPPTSPVRGQRENVVLQQPQEKRQLPTFPLANTMDDFINAGFTNYRKYY